MRTARERLMLRASARSRLAFVRFAQVGPGHFDPVELDLGKVCVPEIGAVHIGARGRGAGKGRALEVGAAQYGARQVGLGEVGVREVGAHEVGSGQIGALETGALKIVTREHLGNLHASGPVETGPGALITVGVGANREAEERAEGHGLQGEKAMRMWHSWRLLPWGSAAFKVFVQPPWSHL
jgi:hypothetical protein